MSLQISSAMYHWMCQAACYCQTGLIFACQNPPVLSAAPGPLLSVMSYHDNSCYLVVLYQVNMYCALLSQMETCTE